MKKQVKKVIFIIVMLFIVATAISLTFGKYAYNSVWNYFLKSKGFYFESDLLDIDNKKNSFLKWDGSDIYFVIKNSLNTELVSEYGISYKITCTVLGEEANYIGCSLNGTNLSEFYGNLSSNAACINSINTEDVSSLSKAECEINGYTWQQDISVKDNYFNLILKDATKNIDEVSVEITAESLTPYNKTLTGVFNLNKVEIEDTEIITNYQSFSEYDELTLINTTSEEKCLLIGFDSNSYLFDLNSVSTRGFDTDSNNNVNQIEVKIGKESSSAYNFYKLSDEKVYSVSNFNVEEKEC